MKTFIKKNSSANFNIIIPIIIATFNIFLILNPSEMITASREGLLLWFNQVLPTLLPFVVGANLLAGLGFIHFIGALMAPVMVPLFKVPGSGAFALLTGLTSGYPMGAKSVAHLYETGQIRQQEAQRLLAFSNNAGPLFVVGFVGAGLFNSARLGYVLLISHITAALGIGLIARFLFPGALPTSPTSNRHVSSLTQAFAEYRKFRSSHYKGFGHVLGTSIKNAMEAMLLVGGFIIVFCVVIKALEVSGIFTVLNFFSNENNSDNSHFWVTGFTAGLLEIANGAKMISQGSSPNPVTLAATAALISFGGFSVHGQTAHFIRDTDIKFIPYLSAKCLHAIIAGGICLLITSYFVVSVAVPSKSVSAVSFIQRFTTASSDFILLAGVMGVMAFCFFSFVLSYRKINRRG